MIVIIASTILFVIFTSLSLIHFYWLFGGKRGLKNVIPTKENQTRILSAPKFATLIVALVLLSFGVIYLVKLDLVILHIPNKVINYVYWIIPSIFMLRAIGDFKYVGLFKRIKNTEFAKADSKWFVPLCLTISVFGIMIQI